MQQEVGNLRVEFRNPLFSGLELSPMWRKRQFPVEKQLRGKAVLQRTRNCLLWGVGGRLGAGVPAASLLHPSTAAISGPVPAQQHRQDIAHRFVSQRLFFFFD